MGLFSYTKQAVRLASTQRMLRCQYYYKPLALPPVLPLTSSAWLISSPTLRVLSSAKMLQELLDENDDEESVVSVNSMETI